MTKETESRTARVLTSSASLYDVTHWCSRKFSKKFLLTFYSLEERNIFSVIAKKYLDIRNVTAQSSFVN